MQNPISKVTLQKDVSDRENKEHKRINSRVPAPDPWVRKCQEGWGVVPVNRTKVADFEVHFLFTQRRERRNDKREREKRGKARKRERLFSKKYF